MLPIISTQLEDPQQRAELADSQRGDANVSFISAAGGREENQDCCAALRAADGSLIVMVADGLGGHRGGRMAAQQAVAGVIAAACAPHFTSQRDSALQDLIRAAQQQIIATQQQQPELVSMRSTLVILIVKEGLASWAHVGDVRLYLLRQGEILHQSRDQSVPQMLVSMGEITPQEIRHHPDRNRLLQALGNPKQPPAPAYHPTWQPLQAGDHFYLMSDGAWEWLEESALTDQPPLDLLERQIISQAAASEPDHDNYTLLQVTCTAAPNPHPYQRATRYRPPTATPQIR
ncbi:MAG: serine/threonine-protein phosphatase [Gammaproteobacteria bacterium]|nr:serine/threonine-protein phosphatase [Gammaproteobacteria bacterium]